MSRTRSSDRSMVPLSYAVDRVRPASIGLSPSLESTEAIFGVMRSPLLATTESLATQMLPPSILVWTLISPNSLITGPGGSPDKNRSEEHTSELQSRFDLVCRLLLEKKKKKKKNSIKYKKKNKRKYAGSNSMKCT